MPPATTCRAPRRRSPRCAAIRARIQRAASSAVAAGSALGWLELQEDGIAALERRVALTCHRLPRLVAEPFGRAEVERLAERVDVAGL